MKMRIFIFILFVLHFSLLNPPQNEAVAATNGSCGISHTAVLTVAPAADLCASGTPSTVTGSGPWIWSCNSTDGGTTASCGAYLKGRPAIELPQTGQTVIYIERDDGSFRAGAAWPSPRFTDNSIAAPADLTVTDNLTSLIWAKSANLAAVTKNWQGALDYIKTLNSGSGYLGHTDWRLPNRNELESLINKGEANSATWLNGQGFYNVQSAGYWSSTTYSNYTLWAWYVAMVSGIAGNQDKTGSNYHVWPVRGGQYGTFGTFRLSKTGQTACYDATGAVSASCSGAGQDGELQTGAEWPTPRFSDNSIATPTDLTATDNMTGLIWTKNANLAGATKSWSAALTYIKSLNVSNYLGHNDWRLPNRNELESLINKGETNPATWLNGQGFSNVQANSQADWYWSSSSYAGNTAFAWYLQMGIGFVGNDNKLNPKYVWPIRGGQAGTFVSLALSKAGTGVGAITSSPTGISCGSICSAGYSVGATLTLTATTSAGSAFTGWGGACSGIAPCLLAMTTNKNVTANFGVGPKAKVLNTGYATLSDAYSAAGADAMILAIAEALPGPLTLNQVKNVTIKGGYTSAFVDPPTGATILIGPLTVQSGSLKVDKLTIK